MGIDYRTMVWTMDMDHRTSKAIDFTTILWGSIMLWLVATCINFGIIVYTEFQIFVIVNWVPPPRKRMCLPPWTQRVEEENSLAGEREWTQFRRLKRKPGTLNTVFCDRKPHSPGNLYRQSLYLPHREKEDTRRKTKKDGNQVSYQLSMRCRVRVLKEDNDCKKHGFLYISCNKRGDHLQAVGSIQRLFREHTFTFLYIADLKLKV
jgi:hypothetical protein